MSAIGGFILDATVTEDHVMEADVTDNPVETGAAITDHVRRKADTLVLDCLVSDSPLGPMVEVRKTEGLDEAYLSRFSEKTPIDPYKSISDEARAYMRQLMDTGEPIVVETATRIYDSMVMQSVTERRDGAIGGGYRFTASFKQIRIVTNDRSTVRVANPAAAKKKKGGHKPSKPDSLLDSKSNAAKASMDALIAKKGSNPEKWTDAEYTQFKTDRDLYRGGKAAKSRRAQQAVPINVPGGAGGHF